MFLSFPEKASEDEEEESEEEKSKEEVRFCSHCYRYCFDYSMFMFPFSSNAILYITAVSLVRKNFGFDMQF